MINLLPYLNKTVVVRRRTGGAGGTGASLDEFNAQNYGVPSSWAIVYAALICRIEITAAPIHFKDAGERVLPNPKMYIDQTIVLQVEDRVYDGTTVYIVQGIQPMWDPVGNVNHYEIDLLIEP